MTLQLQNVQSLPIWYKLSWSLSQESIFDAEQGIQQAVCVRDVRHGEAVALQQGPVLPRAPLLPWTQAEGLQEALAGARPVSVQKDLANQEATACGQGG